MTDKTIEDVKDELDALSERIEVLIEKVEENLGVINAGI